MTSYTRPQAKNSARWEIWRRIEEEKATLEQLLADPPKKANGALTTSGNILTEYQQCRGWNSALKKKMG
ncbi:Uncharacterised protein [Edwardsiella tarda]|uniref:Uncharacterized protein n=1 Tax=Edwardsiella tarda ATCC 15947 = NBRC 105688 TaxID=667121 RepID=A0AC61TLR1_EDWTA|nr:hypothetical protein [Edwardsiella tarda]UAL55326.1 hypothetical protein K8O98_10785 [Edwardsiella tarda]UCQ01629.1 hypothetical protein DCL27_07720 [Edwardsiella tarda ATCC 15947 = NBRC 105688]UCQ12803.1 hypothetical protein DCF76_07840 [Edwardsiella tarda]STD29337.1 Uncharacterised protein [Edwardsiella tarda]